MHLVRQENRDGQESAGVKEVFGHEEIRQVLQKRLPAVSLFVGPKSTGKWQVAEWLRQEHRVSSSDVLRVNRLTQENARFIESFSRTLPQGEFRLCVVRLDGSTEIALNTLLKTLEDTSSTVFILIASERPLPTITSRAEVFQFGLLSAEDVSSVLQNKNFKPSVAKDRAAKSGGRVEPALGESKLVDGKTEVLKALDAIASHNVKSLESLAPKWTQEHTDLLVSWCYESLTGRWKFFTEDETRIRGTSVPLRILMVLRQDIRPRLVVRAALPALL